jgi:S1-C subfamily serine protease
MNKEKKTELSLLAIIALTLAMLIFVGHVYGDVKSAPIDNLVRISIGSPLARSGGSGFLIGDYTVITAEHVVEDPNELYFVQYSDGHLEMIDSRTIIRSDRDDLAMFQVRRNYGKELTIQPTLAEIGTEIYSMGHPYAYRTAYFSTGIVGSERMDMKFYGGDVETVVMMDVHIVSGCSGCPILNMDDEVVGVAIGCSQLITVMVDSEYLRRFLNE